jgi:YD repeat-containing protein
MKNSARRAAAASLCAIGVCLLAVAAQAAPGEVQNLRFDDDATLAWNAAPGAAGYHVYRGDVAGLPDNGDCLLGSIPSTSATVAEDPPPGTAWFYVASAFDATGEGPLGADSGSTPRSAATPCIPSRRSFALTTKGPAGDGVSDGVAPRRNPSARVWSSLRETTGVHLHSGEFFLAATDLVLRGRGKIDFAFERKYRSQVRYDGPLGHGWDFSANMRLVPLGSDVIFHDGAGRREIFGRIDTTHFTSPKGVYAVLHEDPDGSFKLRWPGGRIDRFHAFDGSNLQGALESTEDRNGNIVRFLYDHQGLLTTVVESLGRSIDFAYDDAGRLTTVVDFTGRTWTYDYDGTGDLVSVLSPQVTGTPNGNDFPNGKRTSYGYASGFADPDLNHNLLTVTAPNEEGGGPPTIDNTYGTTPATIERDRVTSQTIGGTNTTGVPSGGVIGYAYAHLNPGAMPDLTTARRETTVDDRNGNLSVHTHNFDGNLLRLEERTNRNVRPGEGDYVTTYGYNADGEVLSINLPEGNRIEQTFDNPGADRYREGNLLERRQIADTVASGGRGDGHGAETADIVLQMTYEPVYNRIETKVEPRGNDPTYVPQNGGVQSAARYTTTWIYDHQEGSFAANGIDAYAMEFEIDVTGATQALGDRNGDGRTDQISGNAVRREEPAVTLDAGSNQAMIEGDTSQDIVTVYRWDDLGLKIDGIDGESNVVELIYHPENDPDGDGNPTPPPADGRTLDTATGGWLATRLRDTTSDPSRNNKNDPTPAMIREDFLYDDVGNRTHVTDGRGVLTRRVFNQLDQVVELRRAAATADASGPDGDPPTGRGETGLTPFGFKVDYEYDANDNLVATRREDRGQDRGVGSFFDLEFTLDLLDNRLAQRREVATGSFVVTRYRYDPNGNRVLTILPEGNAESAVYDERDLRFSRTRGATSPPALAQLAAGDPVNYDVRSHPGSLPATVEEDLDGNGNLVERRDGRGNAWLFAYDGFDRRVRRTDPLGNSTEQCFDPAGNVVRVVRREPGGTPGSACSATSPSDLSQTDLLYDELGRLFGQDRRLFVTEAPNRPAVVVEGPLVPADGFVNRRFEYDRLSRRTFEVTDSTAQIRHDYDGVSRKTKTTLPDGSSMVEWFYDAASSTIEVVRTEASSSAGPVAEEFVETRFYDALGRRTWTFDSIGRATRRTYDSLDTVIAVSDARGPSSGATINRRSPGRTGIVVPINDDGNVTRYTRDGLGRLEVTEHVLTATGEGDGTPNPAPDTSNTFNADGLVMLTTTWDDNSLVQSRVDDRGNTTTYAHDNLNRLARTTADDLTQTEYRYDPADNLVQKTDANGSVLAYTYDVANRRTRLDVTPAAGIVGTTVQTFAYDALDRLTEATDNNRPADADDDVTVGFFYDSLGRRLEEAQTIGAQGGGTPAYTDYEWEAASRMTRLVYPDGRQIDYAYDSADRIVMVDDADAGRPESAALDYFGMGRLHTIDRNNGVRTTMLDDAGTVDVGFDGARRIAMLRHLDGLNADLATFEYEYDAADNLRYERRVHDPVGQDDLRGEVYAHDSLDRLVSFDEGAVDSGGSITGMPNDSADWHLDGVSNWAEMSRNGTTYATSPNNLNEYDENPQPMADDGVLDDILDDTATMLADGRNQAHDDNGNVTLNDDGADADVFEYDVLNRLAGLKRNGVQIGTYLYDAFGRRVSREVENRGSLNETVRYLYASGGGSYAEDRSTSVLSGRVGALINRSIMDDWPPWQDGSIMDDWPPWQDGSIMDDWPPWQTIIEERDAAGATVRQSVVAGGVHLGTDPGCGNNRTLLWQVRNAGSVAEHLLVDAHRSVVALTPGAADTVVERVTYDPHGKPTFENAANVKLCNDAAPAPCNVAPPGTPFIAESTVGNTELYHGRRYDPEAGSRTRMANTDWGGLYEGAGTFYNPNTGRNLGRRNASGWGDEVNLGGAYGPHMLGVAGADTRIGLALLDKASPNLLAGMMDRATPLLAMFSPDESSPSVVSVDKASPDLSGGSVSSDEDPYSLVGFYVPSDDDENECWVVCEYRYVGESSPDTSGGLGTDTSTSAYGSDGEDEPGLTEPEQQSEFGERVWECYLVGDEECGYPSGSAGNPQPIGGGGSGGGGGSYFRNY